MEFPTEIPIELSHFRPILVGLFSSQKISTWDRRGKNKKKTRFFLNEFVDFRDLFKQRDCRCYAH